MRCALIGYGYWGKIIKRYIDDSEYFELVGVCDHHLNGSLQMKDILERGEIEAAFVCVPVNGHFDVVQLLLEKGIHVFCEKPLCRSRGEVDYLFQLSKRQEKVLFADYIYTVSPSLRDIKNYIHDLGRIFYIDMSIKQFGRFYPTDHVFDVIGVHMISALVFLLDTEEGDINVTSVDVIKASEKGMPDAGIMFFDLYDIKGKLECSLLSASKERKIEILCEKGIIVFDMLGEDTVRVISYSKEEGQSTLYECKHDENNNLVFMLEYFYQTILTGDDSNENITKQTADVLDQINECLFDKGVQ